MFGVEASCGDSQHSRVRWVVLPRIFESHGETLFFEGDLITFFTRSHAHIVVQVEFERGWTKTGVSA
jgi:hypothetical protein